MANEKTKGSDEKRDAATPATDGTPERFLSEQPAHLAAQGDKAPPMPNADASGRRRYRMHDKGGAFIQVGEDERGRPVRRLVTAGSVVALDPKYGSQEGLAEVDASGQSVGSPSGDKIASRQTGEATGHQKR